MSRVDERSQRHAPVACISGKACRAFPSEHAASGVCFSLFVVGSCFLGSRGAIKSSISQPSFLVFSAALLIYRQDTFAFFGRTMHCAVSIFHDTFKHI